MLSALTGRATLQETMLRVRLLEDRLQTLCDIGEGADLHFSRGQESISVGVCAALRETDYLVVHHRTIAHAVAKGVPLYPLVAEILGKADGINGGMAGEMHMSHMLSRFMFSFQTVATCIPVAAGIAWAVKNYLKTDDIVAVFHGDAATSNGQWHEGMNLAAIHDLPLLLVCENNRMAGNVRPKDYLPVPFVSRRAAAYGIKTGYVDARDVDAVVEAAHGAAAYVREECRPFLLECETVRLGRHKQGQGDIRTKEEMAVLQERDPLRKAVFLKDRENAIADELDRIIEAARAGANPGWPEVDRWE